MQHMQAAAALEHHAWRYRQQRFSHCITGLVGELQIQKKKWVFFPAGEKAKYLTKSSEVMRNFAGEKKKHSSTRAE